MTDSSNILFHFVYWFTVYTRIYSNEFTKFTKLWVRYVN